MHPDSANNSNGGAGGPGGRFGGLSHPGPDGAPDSAQPAVQARGICCPTPASSCPWAKSPANPATGRHPQSPHHQPGRHQPTAGNWPPRRVEAEAVEGNHAVRIALDPGWRRLPGAPDLPGGPGPGQPGLYALGLCQERSSIGLAEAVLLDPTPGLEGTRTRRLPPVNIWLFRGLTAQSEAMGGVPGLEAVRVHLCGGAPGFRRGWPIWWLAARVRARPGWMPFNSSRGPRASAVPDALSGGSGAGGAPQAAHAPFGG